MTTMTLSRGVGTAHAAQRRARPRRRILVRAAAAATGVAVLALDAHLVGPYLAGATDALRRPALAWVALGLAAEIVSLLALANLQRRMLRAAGTRASMPTLVSVTYAAYAVGGSLPAGTAVSPGYTFRRLRQLGATTPGAGFTMISSSVLSTLAYGLLALAGFVAARGTSDGPVAVLVAVVAGGLLVLATRSLLAHPEIIERIALRALRFVNRLLRREPDAGTPELRRSTRALAAIHPPRRDWVTGFGAALTNWVADLVCLYACCQAVGARGATVAVVLLAYLGGASVSGISLVPGGLGVIDAALVLVLVQNHVAAVPSAAAVLLYRALSLGFGVLTGWIAWIEHAVAAKRRARATGGSPSGPITPRPVSTVTPSHQEAL